jgi:GNAT superfamily N-acetyltransferase
MRQAAPPPAIAPFGAATAAPDMGCGVDLIRADQRDAAVRTLAEAFSDDPLMLLLAPDERRRDRVGRWFFGVTVDYGMRWGRVWVAEDASAVSVWLPPGSTWTTRRSLRVGMGAFPLRVGLRPMLAVMRAAPALERLHASVKGDHWYLVAIGTRPSRQGTGLGGTLLAVGTARADADGVPCYLETATERNVDFYARRGFGVVGQEQIGRDTVYGMVRPPVR